MRWLVVLLVLMLPMLASADTIVLTWDPAPSATSYDVERSANFNVNTGAGTWTVVGANIPSSACVGTPVQCTYTDSAAPATGVYYRLVPKNSSGSLTLNKKGMWYCGACPSPPSAPVTMGLTY